MNPRAMENAPQTGSQTPAQRQELRAFLVDRRSRVQPRALGLRPRNRCQRGLSQADVAEYAGVSLNWYEQFESGRNDRRVSIGFIMRVAAALQLKEDEMCDLFLLRPPRTWRSAQEK